MKTCWSLLGDRLTFSIIMLKRTTSLSSIFHIRKEKFEAVFNVFGQTQEPQANTGQAFCLVIILLKIVKINQNYLV